jgi:asparagine synthase (glutamine-hydrolysing)
MCGIFALLNYQENKIQTNNIKSEFIKGALRGPEFSKLDSSYLKMVLGFHRLAINGLDSASNQPLFIEDIVLICNGEIYNHSQLFKSIGVNPVTGTDCEIIIHLYLKYGIEQTLIMLDGEYSFILYDNRLTENLNNQLFVARDPYGVRPLYQVKPTNQSKSSLYCFASELKCVEKFYNDNHNNLHVSQFKPGTYSIFNHSDKTLASWEPVQENIPYFIPSFPHSWRINEQTESVFISNMFRKISCYLNAAVNKRCLSTERPIACLLSGGLDSSLVTALVNDFYNTHGLLNQLETYSIGLSGSEDLKYAKIVAEYLGTKHTEIIVTEREIFEAIPEVIYAIESYDTTSVRASIGNYLLGKYISKNSEAKVILNGDGSDELFGGYLYMNMCPNDIEFDKETRRLLKDIHAFDVLRSDKCISSHGLEPRTAFLDRSLVDFVLSIPPYFRNHLNYQKCEKYILRNAFVYENFKNYEDRQLLPDSILWRKKEAFSDGVSSQGRSLYKILQEFIVLELKHNNVYGITNIDVNIDTEKAYYKKIFESKFPNCEHIVPYYWMPKFTDATDPSARTLNFYSDNNKEIYNE